MTDIKEKLFRLWVKHKYKNWCLADLNSMVWTHDGKSIN
jgi:hypothetical protein